MPKQVPLRVDLAGGWLDVPKHARPGAYIVNVTFTPFVSSASWLYRFGGGLGGSAAKAVLEGLDAVSSELAFTGWQDPAAIMETGLCVWRSGPRPVLDFKVNPEFLTGRMALLWTGNQHETANLVNKRRRYCDIERAGKIAKLAVFDRNFEMLMAAVHQTYSAQLTEDMKPLPTCDFAKAKKYCGSGHGGYGVYFFESAVNRTAFINRFSRSHEVIAIEPYMNFGGLPE